MSFVNNVNQAIEQIKNGKMLIIVDHEGRENEADIIFPAEKITPEIINFMIRNGSGIVCLSLTEKKMKQLGLTYMVPNYQNGNKQATPFTVSIEAKKGITTGVSAHDRTHTILTAINDQATSDDIVKPGHVFPLCARENGVLDRAGHTEASIDIVSLAGFSSAAALVELMNPDGTMMRGNHLTDFAKLHDIFILSIDDLIQYRQEMPVKKLDSSIRLGVVVSEYNEAITYKLQKSTLQHLLEQGVERDQIELIHIPGAVEIPLTAKMLATSGKFNAIICLGAVIRGETDHYDYVCQQVSDGCQKVMMEYDIPIIFGVLTTNCIEQAHDRTGGRCGDKGKEAAQAALRMIEVVGELRVV